MIEPRSTRSSKLKKGVTKMVEESKTKTGKGLTGQPRMEKKKWITARCW